MGGPGWAQQPSRDPNLGVGHVINPPRTFHTSQQLSITKCPSTDTLWNRSSPQPNQAIFLTLNPWDIIEIIMSRWHVSECLDRNRQHNTLLIERNPEVQPTLSKSLEALNASLHSKQVRMCAHEPEDYRRQQVPLPLVVLHWKSKKTRIQISTQMEPKARFTTTWVVWKLTWLSISCPCWLWSLLFWWESAPGRLYHLPILNRPKPIGEEPPGDSNRQPGLPRGWS